MSGESGADILKGGADDDTLFGGGGNDVLRGNGGDDLINPGNGDDEMAGGGGDDTFVIANGGDNVIVDFNSRSEDRDDVDFRAFFSTYDQLRDAGRLVEVNGVLSTKFVYHEADGDKGSLTLVGYDYLADAAFADHFVI
jgi:Ca2+-binding RTX toxin-like protein